MKSFITQTRSVAATIAVFAAIALPHRTLHADITDWAPVSDPAEGDLNVDPTRNGGGGSLAVLGNKLYVAWHEIDSSSCWQVRVAVYNGDDLAPAWSQVDSRVNGIPRSLSQGITFNPNAGMNNVTSKPRLAVCNGILYAAWSEDAHKRNRFPNALRVARYNGNDAAPDWTFIDGGTTAGLNYNSKKSADCPALVTFQGKLFAFWREEGGTKLGWQLRAKAYSDVSSGSWSWVDGGGATGLNVNPARSLDEFRPAPVVLKSMVHESLDKLYIGFCEWDANSIRQIRAKVYLGGHTWALADGGATLKRNPAMQVGSPTLVAGAFPGGICFSWSERNAAGVEQIRISSYDGANDANPSWIRLDGGDPAVGLNYNPGFSGQRGSSEIVALNGKIYRSWVEASETDGSYQLRVRCWDGFQWSWADGGEPLSTVNPFTWSSDGVSSMAAFNSKLYLLSVEYPVSGSYHTTAFVSVGLGTP